MSNQSNLRLTRSDCTKMLKWWIMFFSIQFSSKWHISCHHLPNQASFATHSPSRKCLALCRLWNVPKKYEKGKTKEWKGFGGIHGSKMFKLWATSKTKDVGRGTTSIVSSIHVFGNLKARAKSLLQTVSIHSPPPRECIKKHRRRWGIEKTARKPQVDHTATKLNGFLMFFGPPGSQGGHELTSHDPNGWSASLGGLVMGPLGRALSN